MEKARIFQLSICVKQANLCFCLFTSHKFTQRRIEVFIVQVDISAMII